MALFTPDKTAAPDLHSPPPELREGVRAVKESVDMGAITEEEGNALIAHLYSAWAGAALTNTVTEQLEEAVALSLGNVAPNESVETESERIMSQKESASIRRYRLAYFSTGLAAAVGMVVFFALTDNGDMITPIVTAAAGIAGGFAVGRWFRD